MGIIAATAAGLLLAPNASAQASAAKALSSADAPASQLTRSATETLPGGAVVSRFTQTVGGVPVVGGGAVVVDPTDSAPELLFDKSVDGLGAPGDPAVSSSQAIAAALAAIGSPAGGSTDARLVIDAARGNQLAWEVTHTDFAPPTDRVVTVSAASGDVIHQENLLRNATGSAMIFEPNAVVANDGYSGIRDRNDKDSAALTSLRSFVVLDDLKDGQSCLKGTYVNARQGSEHKKVCKDSLSWNNVTRSNNKFEALMAYEHVDETQKYIQTLGLPAINEESQNVIVDTIPDDNSFYSPNRDEIQMGTGGVDDGEDADVFVHEYGHAVQDDQNPDAFRGGHDSGAMGEGFGDYLAEAYSTETAGFDAEWSHCVMEWDATSYDDEFTDPPGICLRRTDNPNTLSEQQVECGGGEIHCIGEVWSSALFDLRTSVGDDSFGDSVMDKVTLSSHFLLPESPSFEEGGEALITADENIYGGSDHCAAIRAELVDREILPSTFSC
jgi:Zn-dependent metalloprotease